MREAGNLKPFLFPQLLKTTREWLDTQLACAGGTKPGLFLWKGLADEAALLIYMAASAVDLRNLEEGTDVPANSKTLIEKIEAVIVTVCLPGASGAQANVLSAAVGL